MIINRICEHQNLLSLYLVSFLVGLRTYQHPRSWITTDCSAYIDLLHAVLQIAVTFQCNYANWYGIGWRQSGFLFLFSHANYCWLTGVHGVFLNLGLTLGSSILASASSPVIQPEYRCYDLKPLRYEIRLNNSSVGFSLTENTLPLQSKN